MNIKPYEFEINYIKDNLETLEKGEYLERNNGEANASTIARNIRETFVNLMISIAKDEPGIAEKTLSNLSEDIEARK